MQQSDESQESIGTNESNSAEGNEASPSAYPPPKWERPSPVNDAVLRKWWIVGVVALLIWFGVLLHSCDLSSGETITVTIEKDFASYPIDTKVGGSSVVAMTVTQVVSDEDLLAFIENSEKTHFKAFPATLEFRDMRKLTPASIAPLLIAQNHHGFKGNTTLRTFDGTLTDLLMRCRAEGEEPRWISLENAELGKQEPEVIGELREALAAGESLEAMDILIEIKGSTLTSLDLLLVLYLARGSSMRIHDCTILQSDQAAIDAALGDDGMARMLEAMREDERWGRHVSVKTTALDALPLELSALLAERGVVVAHDFRAASERE